ncbi:MAG: glycosyltransferase family 87 protein [Maritimibacter sp.]
MSDPPKAYLEFGLAQDGARGDRITPYLYPPLWAALMAPVTKILSIGAFFKLWLIINLASSVFMIWLGWLWIGRGISPVIWVGLALALLTVTVIGQMGFAYGQPQVLVNCLIVGAFFAVSRAHNVGGGALLGLAAAIKLAPIALAVVLLMERRWVALGACLGVFGALAGLSVLVTGWPLHAALLDKLSEIDAHIMVARITTSLELVLAQIGGLIHGAPIGVEGAAHMTPQPEWIGPVVRCVLVAGIIASWAWTRKAQDDLRIWLRLMAVYLVVLVCGPLAWVHALGLPLVLLPGMLRILPMRGAVAVLGGAAIGFSMPLFFWVAENPAFETAQIWANLILTLGLFAVLLGAARGALVTK